MRALARLGGRNRVGGRWGGVGGNDDGWLCACRAYGACTKRGRAFFIWIEKARFREAFCGW